MKMRTVYFTCIGLATALLLAACSGKKEAPTATTPADDAAAVPADLPARVPMNEISLELVDKAVKLIEADAAWLQQVKDKAAAGNMPLAYQLKDDARFFLFEHQAEYGVIQVPDDVLQAQMDQIKKDAAWFATIEQQAKERGISVEESLRKNALYMIDQRLLGK
jgi:hypothetical protein